MWKSSTNAYITPRTFLLEQDNYLNWSILMERNIERLGWADLLKTPWKGTSEPIANEDSTYTLLRTPPASDNGDGDDNEEVDGEEEEEEELSRRKNCSLFLLENINTTYWSLVNPKEWDPYILWGNIKEAWSNFESKDRIKAQIETMKPDKKSMFEYVANAQELFARYNEVGGEMEISELIGYILESLTMREETRNSIRDDMDVHSDIEVKTVLRSLMRWQTDLMIKRLKAPQPKSPQTKAPPKWNC